MKVLLVKPYNLSDHIQPSLGLGYLASSIRNGHEVEILDCIKKRIKPSDFSEALDRAKPDVVGIQCYTYDLYNIKDMLKVCKKREIKTVLGGPHPSAVPGETMEFFGNDVDYLFQGEAEIGFRNLLDKLSDKSNIDFEEIPGLAWRNNGKVFINDKYFLEDIDSLGMPAWDLISPQEYPEAQHGAFFKKFPIAPIMITRGCPFSCTFCAGKLISGKSLRKRSIRNIINEMETLYHDYGIREFHIIDDNFTLDRAFVKEFLKNLKKLDLDITWAVPNGIRMDTLDDELLELMKETGLYLISLGIESGSDRILGLMKKNITTDKIRRAIGLIKKHNIDIAGFFILGFPGETVEDIKKTIRFSLEFDLIRANFFTYLPFPGTESFNDLKRRGKLEEINFKRFYFMNATFTPDGIDRSALKALQRKAFLRFFLRPRILIKNLMQVKSFRHFKFLLNRFFKWMLVK
ncbi:MAG: B12-binding domain-containing radical SAM protein [Candidatus Omnitrophota bacterium]|nr:MAG: B12-binding domain-containing radical SAM protein [Candidatus Omnitrophota bacterium]